ncbi:hypothetical protein quinque_016488 [Culex quinquefasciatus]
MESGVPQGTILAVTLFLVRMTEVKRYIPKGVGLKLYADDILLFAHGKSAVYVRKKIQEAVANVETWTQFLGFELASTKSSIIHIYDRPVPAVLCLGQAHQFSNACAPSGPLGPAHVAGIRSASGAFRSSPCKAIYAESGQLPFEHAATVVTVTKAVSLAAGGTIGPHHSLSKRAKEDFNRITRLELPDVERKLRIGDRPWHVEKPKVDWEMTAYDILLWAKNAIRLAWEREWHSERDLHLRRVKPNTMPGTDRPSQEEQRALTRLRIGHTRLTHEGLFRGERAMCDTCGVPLTVEHIICSCRKFDQHRDDTACNIYGALNNDPEAERKLLLYLRNTKLLEQI